ncbi:TolC family protein [Thalassotalea sp. 1_MG-2023]|uniref:TolC family protein n=1 Tax=Thalassotalea sp. 1_MG-2023 TaxID=3062680 RepID=UPI0026E1FC18|nr:TolC family protein [Thalassotalea sp. 1_MG-2023]MDO6427572.1 TolC family protein [Thalassotalea sp. 1_MG-2023]
MINSLLPSNSRLALTLLLTNVIAGCATSNKVDVHLENQQQLQHFVAEVEIASELAGASELNWWQQFNSPQLNLLIQEALTNNYDLSISHLRLKSALARLGAEQAMLLPQGGLTISSERSSIDEAITPYSTASLGLNWHLDLFGRVTALVNAANASALSQAEQLRLLQIEVVSSVVSGYISYQGNLQKHHIISQQIDALQQSIEVLQASVDEGVTSELDLNRTKAQLNQQQALLPEIEFLLHRDNSALAYITGKTLSDLTLMEQRELINFDLQVHLTKPSEAIALRPDISKALYQFSQATALSTAASKALLPDISLRAFAGILSSTSTTLSNTKQQWQVSPQIEWSLLSYPALLAQRDAQQYLSEAAYNEYQKTVLNAINESELSLHKLVKESNKQQFANNRYHYANKAYLQAQAMFQEGQIPYLSLLDARQDLLAAEENAVDSAISTLLTKVNAYHTFNGRWSYALSSI